MTDQDANKLAKLGAFLVQHYPSIMDPGSADYHRGDDAAEMAIRLLSVANSPAHRAAHLQAEVEELMRRLGVAMQLLGRAERIIEGETTGTEVSGRGYWLADVRNFSIQMDNYQINAAHNDQIDTALTVRVELEAGEREGGDDMAGGPGQPQPTPGNPFPGPPTGPK